MEHDESGLLLDVALRAISKYGKVAIVSAASAHQLGGGFLTGGRHALEEALCMQTTLYPSLVQARELAKNKLVDHVGKGIHIPEHGCILSPKIEVYYTLGDVCPGGHMQSLATMQREAEAMLACRAESGSAVVAKPWGRVASGAPTLGPPGPRSGSSAMRQRCAG